MAWVYILRCSDGALYVGVTEDLEARLDKHNRGLGSKFTACRRPVELIFHEHHDSTAAACARERQIKGWRRAKKEALAQGNVALLKQL